MARSIFGRNLDQKYYTGKRAPPEPSVQWTDALSPALPTEYADQSDLVTSVLGAEIEAEETIEVPEMAVPQFVQGTPGAASTIVASVQLEDVLRYFKSVGVVGEERTIVKGLYKLVNAESFCIEGPAGSGKTFLLKQLMGLVPKEYFHRVEFVTSESALFYDADTINQKRFLYIPEYQKILQKCKMLGEVFKTLLEGETATRQITVQDKDAEAGRKTISCSINPIAIVTALADENEMKKRIDANKEDRRRFSHVYMDTSIEQTRNIHDSKANARCSIDDGDGFSQADLDALKDHVSACLNLGVQTFDPFAEFIAQYLPQTPRSRAFVDDYYSYLDASARFHHMERRIPGAKDKKGMGHARRLFLDLADQFLVYQVYHDDYCRTLAQLDDLPNLAEFMQQAQEEVNWKACFEHGVGVMQQSFSAATVKHWAERQLSDGHLKAWDPITQEEIVLATY